MPQLKLTEPDFRDLLMYESTLKTLQLISQLDDLNTYLVLQRGQKYPTLFFQDSLAFVKITVPSHVEVTWAKGEVETDLGLTFNHSMLFQILHNYSEEARTQIVFTLTFGDRSSFRVDAPGDRILLPHAPTSLAKINELVEILDPDYPSADIGFQLSRFGEAKSDFLQGLMDCMVFIAQADVLVTNAVAIFDDRVTVGDVRHIFTYRYITPVSFLNHTDHISLHRTSARLFLSLAKKNVVFDASITSEGKRVFISAPHLEVVVNNSKARAVPLDDDNYTIIHPTTIVTRLEAGVLLNSANFFSGFYRGTMDNRPINLQILPEELVFTLTDDGVAGFNSCNVERRISTPTNDVAFESTTIYDSMVDFLKVCDPSEEIEIYLDDHPSVYLSSYQDRRSIYISKLTKGDK